jgi:hypothetical protein
MLAFTLTEWIAGVSPDGYLLGRRWLLYCFAPLTLIGTAAVAVLWARRLRASAVEGVAALVLAELLAWGVVAHFYGAWFGPYVFSFWIAANVVFAPSWLVGAWLGRITERSEQETV